MGVNGSKDEPSRPVEQTIIEDVDEFEDGEMKEVEVEGHRVLVVKNGDTFHAVGAECPCGDHDSLVDGVLHKGRLRCAKHGAVFDVTNGDQLDYPAVDCIPAFELKRDEKRIIITTDMAILEKKVRIKRAARFFTTDKRIILILGGGPAAVSCAEVLRQEGFIGRIVVATKEKHLPYDRTKLAKIIGEGHSVEQITFRDKKFYSDRDIQIRLEKEPSKLSKNKIIFKDGEEIVFHKLLIATEASARNLTMVPGYDLGNVVTLRTIQDAQYIAAKAVSNDVVIIGTSFIGMKIAEAVVEKAKSVTLVSMSDAPFQSIFGKDIGNELKSILEKKGIKFHLQNTVKEFVAESGRLKRVVLKDGVNLDAALCIVTVGSQPVIEFLKGSGITMSSGGYIIVNKQMKTNKDDIYSAGDITEFPLFLANDANVTVHNLQMIQMQGRVAALNMLDKATNIHSVSFVSLQIGGQTLRFAGYSVGHDNIVVRGKIEEQSFVAYFVKDGKVVAVASFNRDPVASQVAELLIAGDTLLAADIRPKAEHPTWLDQFPSATPITHF